MPKIARAWEEAERVGDGESREVLSHVAQARD